jgi:hypothetical protein
MTNSPGSLEWLAQRLVDFANDLKVQLNAAEEKADRALDGVIDAPTALEAAQTFRAIGRDVQGALDRLTDMLDAMRKFEPPKAAMILEHAFGRPGAR